MNSVQYGKPKSYNEFQKGNKIHIQRCKYGVLQTILKQVKKEHHSEQHI